jgi:hypothetical protein
MFVSILPVSFRYTSSCSLRIGHLDIHFSFFGHLSILFPVTITVALNFANLLYNNLQLLIPDLTKSSYNLFITVSHQSGFSRFRISWNVARQSAGGESPY